MKNDKEIYFCQKHANIYTKNKIMEIEGLIEKITDKMKTKKCEFDECKKNCEIIFDEHKYCSKHQKKIYTDLIKSNKLITVKKISCMRESLVTLGERMYDAIDKRPEILLTDKIVIENQPTQKNPTMKSISVLLLSYFIMKHHKDIDFIAPSGKLKVNEKLTKEILTMFKKDGDKYGATKELGIKYTEKLLQTFNNNETFRKILSEEKKQDDLCDSFLHAYYHSIGTATEILDEDFFKETKEYFQIKKNNKKEKTIEKQKEKEKTIKLDC